MEEKDELNKFVSDEIKKIEPEEAAAEVTPEAQEAGFRNFPDTSESRFKLPAFQFDRKKFGLAGGILLILLVLLVFFGVLPALAAYKLAQSVLSSAKGVNEALQSQKLGEVKTSLDKVKGDLNTFNLSLLPLAWTRVVPFVGGYWQDARHAAAGGLAAISAAEIILPAIEPYADILGFDGGEAAGDGAKTAEDRINFIVQTIDEIAPKLGEIGEKTQKMTDEINKINPNRYPEHFRGIEVRAQIKTGQTLVDQVNDFATRGKPLLEQASFLLGIDGERTYLLLFQNDKEIRPTGGFITAYSIVKVRDGKFNPVSSNDIYNLDNRFRSRIPAPEPIKKYLPLVPYWYLRDMNLSADFKISMDTFKENFDKTKVAQVDGIIAVDTKPVVDLLAVMGQIGVPGFGNFSANEDPRCNCPQVIYELESFADVAGPIIWAEDLGGKIILKPPHADNRKLILGPLMNSIIANAMGQPKDKIPGLFTAAWNALLEKHVLLYLADPEAQKAVEEFGIGGRLKPGDGDYLHINDTNFAGAKSNLYVQGEVTLKVDPGRDGTTNTLTIKYKNPQKHDGWLNGPFRDWVRVYVPKGSQLLDSTGSEVPVTTSEDLDKTVFEGFFTLRPEGVIELNFKYKTPARSDKGYKILIQKQPGTEGHQYVVEVDGDKEEFRLTTDKELRF